MATRVFELARELGVKSKDILVKCRAEEIEVKNHMASLSAGLEETIREWFSEDSAHHTAVELTKHVDLDEARQRAQKTRKRKTAAKKVDEAAVTEDAETPASESTDEQLAPAAEVKAPEAETEPPAATDESPTESVVEPVAEKPAPEPEPDPKPKPVVPAGPQVVPKPAQLKGPRVIRVEKPDYIPRPRPREGGYAGAGGPPRRGMRGPVSLADERNRTGGVVPPPGVGAKGAGGKGGPGDKKTTRRSPRRKGGRTGLREVGEKLKEWRDADLAERAERIKGAGSSSRRHRAAISGGGIVPHTKQGKIPIEEPITVKSLSAATGLKAAIIIRRLMEEGLMATVNQVIKTSEAEMVVADYDIELDVQTEQTPEDLLVEKLSTREKGTIATRAPVVTFLGHVDHGKTSLLDRIRNTSVAGGEAGGITQAVGSYRHDQGDAHVVFLDTPGHEAFTEMRARGANMTDVVVLVVAADDGVMPQTVEAISHAKAAEVPIVVALNKVDVSNANVQRALGQLAEYGLQPRQWGGDTEVIETSAETGQGVDELVELLSLEAEILELKAEPDAPASGFVIESRIDPGRGTLATLLVRDGTLKVGDVLLAGQGFGRVRQIYDDKGKVITEAGPATPVSVTGLDTVPEAGDKFYIVSDIDEARAVAEHRRSENRAKALNAASNAPKSLEELIGKIEEGQTMAIPLILKADVQGSIEAITGTLNKLGNDEVKLNILHTGVGGITMGDVTLAEASGAIIIGFNVVAAAPARKLAEAKNVDIRAYRVIYEITEDMQRVMEGELTPEIREETLGRAEIRQTFKASKLGTIAGCYVTEGLVNRNAKVRIIRNNVVVEDERSLDSLKRVKDDAREVKAGLECGLKISGYDDIKEGDILEFYTTSEVARKL
ncbi:MAG: translation initiation factor IF-2 [Phycisphaerae bacterium]|nr:translation initiation factor IF-2 [Phycisphaerae bacterium]